MKHLASIQVEFVKEARKWDSLSYDEQTNYLRHHPGSRRRMTAKPGDIVKKHETFKKEPTLEQYISEKHFVNVETKEPDIFANLPESQQAAIVKQFDADLAEWKTKAQQYEDKKKLDKQEHKQQHKEEKRKEREEHPELKWTDRRFLRLIKKNIRKQKHDQSDDKDINSANDIISVNGIKQWIENAKNIKDSDDQKKFIVDFIKKTKDKE